ncbi:hypothetical protein GUJ93_ZPchr0458g22498 [Zizania palustris]|uniref:Zinc finger LSD1-type domain-containing protein n=1 Tax=Zizania palustris TaxID=103762 RepID=A0A8J5RRG6_ZIZPA|nr:hypothetical protein GUJ93_ZPchr0458g22498 [Zizania palustris]
MEFVEVRCAGCGETLEVEPGVTEFACPDCGTQQALPPELMPPPPPRPRRALPIPGRGPAAAAPARMPCGGCGAVLSVPPGLGRFACPLCCLELVVDGGRLRLFSASPAVATVSVVAPPPAGVMLTSPSLRQRPEAQIERYDHPIRSEQSPAHCSIRSIPIEETFNSVRIHSQAAIQRTLARKEPASHSNHIGESRNETVNKTTARPGSRNTRLCTGTESIHAEKVQPQPPIEVSTPQEQACSPSNSVCKDHIEGQQPLVNISSHGQQASDVSSSMEQEKTDPLNQAVHLKQAHTEYQCKTTGWNPKRKKSSKSTIKTKKKKNKALTSSQNERFHLRRSERLTKQPEQPIKDDPVQQPAVYPNLYNSDPPNIDRLISILCPSPLRHRQMPQASPSVSSNADATLLPTSSNRGMPRAEQFLHCYSQLYPPEVRVTTSLTKVVNRCSHSRQSRRMHIMTIPY